jgi:hypothetical protein
VPKMRVQWEKLPPSGRRFATVAFSPASTIIMALVFRQNAPPDGTHTTARLALLGRERTPARPGGNSRYTCTGWHYPAPGGAIVHAASRNGNPPGTSVLLRLTIDHAMGPPCYPAVVRRRGGNSLLQWPVFVAAITVTGISR